MSEPKISTKQNLSEAFAELRKLNPLLELTDREINGINFKVFQNAPKTMRDLFGAIELLQGDFPFISEDANSSADKLDKLDKKFPIGLLL